MVKADSVQMCGYELPLPAAMARSEAEGRDNHRALPESFLVNNVAWFCNLRWIVIALLVAYGMAGLVPDAFRRVGLVSPTGWPFAAAGTLAIANLGFLRHARLLGQSATAYDAKFNLWSQILIDLAVLTVVVHFVGSLDTYAPFLYLFHIVLACIFFSRPESLIVTLLSCMLYTACVRAEVAGVIGPAGIFADTTIRQSIELSPSASLLNVASAVVTWLVVWHLTAHLSALLRERDHELAETNVRLEELQAERTKHMLRTTHELKAPFAAIHANVQLLSKGHCGVLSDEALVVVRRVSERCRRLGTEIQEMLQLANLDYARARAESVEWIDLDLAGVLSWCIGQARQTAEEHGVIIDSNLEPARAVGVEDPLRMLFSNLLANAVVYSREGDRVEVRCTKRPEENGPVVIIQDHGIGIPCEKLPRIFDQYYRTEEAVRHNKESTGLGLAIVRQVAEAQGIRVRVESLPSLGTRFEIRFPSTCETLQNERREGA